MSRRGEWCCFWWVCFAGEILLPPSQKQLSGEIQSALEAVVNCDHCSVYDRCSQVAGDCAAYLEMISPHSRFRLRELLTRLQAHLEKVSVTKASSHPTSHYRDLQSVLQDLSTFISKWFVRWFLSSPFFCWRNSAKSALVFEFSSCFDWCHMCKYFGVQSYSRRSVMNPAADNQTLGKNKSWLRLVRRARVREPGSVALVERGGAAMGSLFVQFSAYNFSSLVFENVSATDKQKAVQPLK